MKHKKITILAITIILTLLLTQTTIARTKQEAINDFFDSVKQDLGYKNSQKDSFPAVTPTSQIIQLAPYLNYKLPDNADLYYFFQTHQNQDYGFSEKENQTSDFNSTIEAIYGLINLKTNISIIDQWGAIQFLNTTITRIITYNQTIGNNTIIKQKENLTISQIVSVAKFIEIASIFKFQYKINITKIILASLNLQFKNGSYISLYHAYAAIKFLSIFTMQPKDVYGATMYLLSLRIGKTGFAKTPLSQPTLKETFLALEALKMIGYDVSNIPDKGDLVKFVLTKQQKSGGFKEKEEPYETVKTTYYALKILILLNSLNELQQKELLVAEGFLKISIFAPLLTIISIPVILRKKLQ